MMMKSEYLERGRMRAATIRGVIAGFLAISLLVLSACSSSSNGNNGGSSGGQSAGASAGGSPASSANAAGSSLSAMKADLAKATATISTYPAIQTVSGGVGAMKGKTVWWIPVAESLPFMAAIGNGMQAALAKEGANLHVCDGKFVPTSIASCMDDAAAQNAGAVVTGYIDYSLVPNAFDNLVAKHIPVLVAGEAKSGGKTNSPQLAFYDTIATLTLLQKLMAEAVIVDSNSKANVLFLNSTDSSQLKSNGAYTRKYFADNCPGCSVNSIDYLTVAASKLPSQVSAGLISHPNTNYVVEQLDPTAGLVISAIQNAGKTNSVKYTGTGGSLDTLQRLKSGNTSLADPGLSGIYAGWQFVDGISRMVAGSTPVATVTATRLFTKQNVSGLTLTAGAYASNAWYGNDSYVGTFTKAWGLAG